MPRARENIKLNIIDAQPNFARLPYKRAVINIIKNDQCQFVLWRYRVSITAHKVYTDI